MATSKNVLLLLLRRSFAFLYDLLLLVAMYFVVTALLLTLNDGNSIQHPSFYALLWLLGGVFFTSFWRHGGQTLGMRAWQLRLAGDSGNDESPDATPIEWHRLWQRYLIGTLLFGIGYVWAVFDARSRTASDRLTRSVIIRDSEWLKHAVKPD